MAPDLTNIEKFYGRATDLLTERRLWCVWGTLSQGEKKAGIKRGGRGFREFSTFVLFTNWLLRYEIITSLYKIYFYVEQVLFWNLVNLIFSIIYGRNSGYSTTQLGFGANTVIAPHWGNIASSFLIKTCERKASQVNYFKVGSLSLMVNDYELLGV